jgi:trans-L-3-hydroxyproline dehydratase
VLTIKTIDAHVGGEPLRLVVEGFPAPRGRTMMARRAWASRHADALRRAIILEPRGHADMYGAVLTEPVSPGAHAGILFMHNAGYDTLSVHGVMAAATVAIERGLLMPGGDGRTMVFDTPAGPVRALVKTEPARTFHESGAQAGPYGGLRTALQAAGSNPPSGGAERQRTEAGRERLEIEGRDGRAVKAPAAQTRVSSVTVSSVPSFVAHGGVDVPLGARHIRADVAFAGAFFAIVDAESTGLAIDGAHVTELRRAAREIRSALDRTIAVVHPQEPAIEGVSGTIFTGPPNSPAADLRNVTVFADEQVDRSASGSATSAVMAVLDAMGLLDEGRPFTHEGIIGTRMTGRVAARTRVGDYAAIVPELEARAWITGEHTFIVEDDDPLCDAFRL